MADKKQKRNTSSSYHNGIVFWKEKMENPF